MEISNGVWKNTLGQDKKNSFFFFFAWNFKEETAGEQSPETHFSRRYQRLGKS